MGRNTDETIENWYRRTVHEFRAAQVELCQEWERLGLQKVILHGEPYPLVDRAYEKTLMRTRELEDEMLQAARAARRLRQTPVRDVRLAQNF